MPWQKGESGNPLGRKVGSLDIVAALTRELRREWIVPQDQPDAGEKRTRLDQVCRAMITQAAAGSVPAADWVANRLWGRPTSRVEVEGSTESRVVVVPWLPATMVPPPPAASPGEQGLLGVGEDEAQRVNGHIVEEP